MRALQSFRSHNITCFKHKSASVMTNKRETEVCLIIILPEHRFLLSCMVGIMTICSGKATHCYDTAWELPNYPIATSIKPHFKKTESHFRQKTETIEWIFKFLNKKVGLQVISSGSLKSSQVL